VDDSVGVQMMSMEKMRTLLALLLKKISTPSRLKKLGFGSRLIGIIIIIVIIFIIFILQQLLKDMLPCVDFTNV